MILVYCYQCGNELLQSAEAVFEEWYVNVNTREIFRDIINEYLEFRDSDNGS